MKKKVSHKIYDFVYFIVDVFYGYGRQAKNSILHFWLRYPSPHDGCGVFLALGPGSGSRRLGTTTKGRVQIDNYYNE